MPGFKNGSFGDHLWGDLQQDRANPFDFMVIDGKVTNYKNFVRLLILIWRIAKTLSATKTYSW